MRAKENVLMWVGEEVDVQNGGETRAVGERARIARFERARQLPLLDIPQTPPNWRCSFPSQAGHRAADAPILKNVRSEGERVVGGVQL